MEMRGSFTLYRCREMNLFGTVRILVFFQRLRYLCNVCSLINGVLGYT
jgi:hypothetical protein